MSSIDPEVQKTLNMRLAKGDIDVDQYQTLLNAMARGDSNSSVSGKDFTASLPLDFGSLRHSWRKMGGPSWNCRMHNRERTNSERESRLRWLQNVVDYLITDEYFIVLASAPDSKGKQFAENAASVAMVAGAISGTLLVALPVILVGTAYEKIFGPRNAISSVAVDAIFSQGYAIWAKKTELTFLSYTVKPSSFDFAYAIVVITGKFRVAVLGEIELCFILSEKQGLNPNISVVKPLKEAGCSITESPNRLRSPTEVDGFLPSEFPDPFQAHIDEIAWCSNCSHFLERRAWHKGISFISMKRAGDCTLASKPSNDKLPCDIPNKTQETWDRYFGLSNNNRSIYAGNCSEFARKRG